MTPEELAHLSEGKTVATLFCDVVRDRTSQQSLRWKSGDDWHSLTYAEYGQQVARVASALRSLHVEPETRVSLLLRNSPERAAARHPDIGLQHVISRTDQVSAQPRREPRGHRR
jgi:long-subunit acyl-CoA synthetase (AMP-forming)